MLLPTVERESSRGLLAQVLAGSRLGAVVPGALATQAAYDLVRRATAGELAAKDPIHYEGATFGPTLVSALELEEYFAEADTLAHVDAAGIDVEACVGELLAWLADAPVTRARKERAYAPLGLRMLAPGGSIALHCENETRGFAPMRELASELDAGTIVSFYVTLAVPEAGGELEVYPLRYAEGAGAALSQLERRGPRLEALLAQHPPTRVRSGVGDLVFFDAGRHFHRVSEVEGARARWTLGGFVARTRRGSLVYWN